MVTPELETDIKPRKEYFIDFIKNSATEEEEKKVISKLEAVKFIRRQMNKDMSLGNLRRGLDEVTGGYEQFLETDYIKNLIKNNTTFVEVERAQKKLDVSIEKLARQRISLNRLIPKREAVTRRKVITIVMTNEILSKYGFKKSVNKKRITQYRDLKGRFVSNEKLLDTADKIIAVSRNKRKQVEFYLKRDFMGKNKK